MTTYTKPDHHEDAYKLVTYQAPSGERVKLWNATSRAMPIDICLGTTTRYMRVEYQRDEYAPDYALACRLQEGDAIQIEKDTVRVIERASVSTVEALRVSPNQEAIGWAQQCRAEAAMREETKATAEAHAKALEDRKVVKLENRRQKRAREATEQKARNLPEAQKLARQLQRIVCALAATSETGQIEIPLDIINGALPDVQFETVVDGAGKHWFTITVL